MATEVSINDLSTWLSNQPANTKETPYEITITGLTTSNYNDIKTALTSNSTKYVDLSTTSIPNTVTEMRFTFSGCTSLVNAPIIPDSVTNMLGTFNSCTSLVNTPIIPNGVGNMNATFRDCTSLVNAPVIPNTITNMSYAFNGCTSLVNAPIIPDSVTSMSYAFGGCTSLSYKAIIPSSVSSSTGCYNNVTTNNWGGTEEQVSDFLSTFLSTATTDCNLYVIDAVEESNIFNIIDTIYAVSIENLSDLLESLEDNTANDPYKIALINLTTTNISDIQSNLISNATKFVDLRYTLLPSGSNVDNLFYYCINLVYGPVFPSDITSMNRTFIYCSNLKESPEIPSSVTSMMYTFEDCENLIVPPTIPNGVTDITEIFFNCESLEIAPSIPSSVVTMDYAFVRTKIKTGPYISEGVESMNEAFVGCDSMLSIPNVPSTITEGYSAFSGCTELVSIDRFAIPLATLKNNTDFENMFADCGALERIGYIVSEAEDWHVFRLKVSSGNYGEVEGKVYDREGNSVSIPYTTLTLGTLTIPVLVDELWFPPSDMSDTVVDDKIEEVIACRYSYFNKMVVNPDKKSFVLYADDPDEVITNLNLGGTDITVYDTLAEANADLPNLSEGDIIGTEQGGDGVTDTIAEGEMRAVTSNAVANALSYSTSETLTGGTWTDGKPIYRKVISINNTLSTMSTTVLSGLNIDNLIRNDLLVYNNSLRYILTDAVQYNANTKNVSFKSGTSSLWCSRYVVEYTKTTD